MKEHKIETVKTLFQQQDLTALPAWLADVRTRALAAVVEQGLPDRHWESWRYTPIQQWLEEILALPLPQRRAATPAGQPPLPGVHIHCTGGQPARAKYLPEGVELYTLADLAGADKHPCTLWLQAQTRRVDPLANLATAFGPSPSLLHIRAEQPQTLHIWHSTEREQMTLPVLLIWLEAGAGATVVEHFGVAGGDYICLNRSDILLNHDARLRYYRLNNDSDSSKHIGYLGIEQHANSQCDVQVLTSSGAGVRNTLHIEQIGTGAQTRVRGNAWVTGTRHCDYQLSIRHLGDCGQSDSQLYSLAADRGSIVSNGLIHIARHTRDNAAEFQSRNLLLSEQAQINTKPELEIYADQVQCSHGASIGRLDEQALFYLRSRGIGEQAARSLLLYSFLQSAWLSSGDAALDSYCQQLRTVGLQTLVHTALPAEDLSAHALSPSFTPGEEEHRQ